MESVVLCGKKRNSVMYMVYFLCICMSPLCCLFWYGHQMCCYHRLLAGIDLLEYLHRERVVLFIIVFIFSDIAMSTVVVVGEVCVAKVMNSLCHFSGEVYLLKRTIA